MFVSANKKVKSAIFPIFAMVQQPQGVQLAHLGAAFFIDNQGTFATCAHLFDNAPPGARFVYLGHLPDHLQNPPMNIVELGRDNAADVVIGRLNMPNPTAYLELAAVAPESGKQVCIVGYPLAAIVPNAQGGPELGGVRRYPQPSFVIEGAEVEVGNGRVHRGFCVRDVGHSGMSGGPVVDEDGVVLGMQGSVIHRQYQLGPHRVVVHNAIVIAAEHIRALWEEIKDEADDAIPAQLPGADSAEDAVKPPLS